MSLRMVAYIEVDRMVTETPMLMTALDEAAKREVPPGYQLGERQITDSDDHPEFKKVVVWDVVKVE